MNKIEDKPVLTIITEKYDEIFQAERKVADFILRNPNEAINLNVSELATRSGVSDATVIRLCKHLGYQGYYQLKVCLFRDIGYRETDTAKKNPGKESSLSAYVKEMGTMISKIVELNEENAFDECVKIIKNSATVYLCALGNTATLSMYTGFRLERLGFRSSFDLQPEFFMNHINLATENDCLIAISESGTSRSIVTAMELARKRKMKVIAISAYGYSPVSRLADVLLQAPVSGNRKGTVQHSRLGEMAILDILFLMLENEISVDKSIIENPEILLSETKY